MKYCPNCGKEVQADDKFCENCGFNLEKVTGNLKVELHDNSSDRIRNVRENLKEVKRKAYLKLTNFRENYKKLSRKNKKLLYCSIVAIIAILFVGIRISHNGSLFTPRNISFVKQANQSGKYVWLKADGQSKNSEVSSIYVVGGKGITEYYLEDDLTLGELSNKTKKQLIKIGKDQDYKYFKAYQSDLQDYMNSRDGKGQNRTFTEQDNGHVSDKADMILDGANIYYVNNAKDTSENVKFQPSLVKLMNPSNVDDSSNDNLSSVPESSIAPSHSLDSMDKYQKMRATALMNVMKSTKYRAPKKQKLHYKNNTDSTGNNVISQKLTYNSVDTWLSRKGFDEGIYKYADKEALTKAIAANEPSIARGREKIKKMGKKEYAKAVNPDVYRKAMQGAFYYSDSPYQFDLTTTTSFDIYKTKFIGYITSNGNYLVTKAKNNSQKAIMGN